MQIKTTLRFYLTPVRMAKIKDSGDSRCWWGCGERGTLLHCWWDCKLAQPLWKSVRQFLRKLDIVQQEDPAIPLLGIYPEVPTGNKNTCSTMFRAALFIIARSLKEPRCPSTDEWVESLVLLHSGVPSSYSKQWIYEILNKWMDLEDNILSEVTHSQKNTHAMHSLISGY